MLVLVSIFLSPPLDYFWFALLDAGSPGAAQESTDLMYPCGKAMHVSRREGTAFKQVLGMAVPLNPP
jgi:hypothetical protein